MILTVPLKWQGILVAGSLLAPLSVWASGATSSIVDSRSILISVAVLLGSIVVGAAGFGAAVVGGAIMLFWFVPISAVPILTSASLTTQLISLGQLWKVLQPRGWLPLIVGGLIGIPFGVWLLQKTDPDVFRMTFGIFLMCWSVYLLIRPQLRFQKRGPLADGIVGVTGGITSGTIAFPAALPAIWCALTRDTMEAQRGTIQMYVVVMQSCTFIYLLAEGMIDKGFILDYLKMLPAIMIGTFVGVHLFGKINPALFRRLVLLLLLIAASAHAIHGFLDFFG
jgi:uncharacterized membrane protein YfcA